MLASYDDSGISHYGPGALHLRELMAYAIGMGLKRFDFTIGDEPYKLEWSDTTLKLYDFARHRDLAWPASANRFNGAAPRQALYQADAVGVAPGFTRQIHDRPAGAPAAVAFECHQRDRRTASGDAACGRVRHGRHGFVAAAGIGRCALRGCHAGRRAFALLPLRAISPGLGLITPKIATALVDALVSFGKAQSEPPVLFYEEDAQVLLVSRHRERLARAFRFVIADEMLVEDLLDKARFQVLAERHGLPVQAGRRFDPAALESADLGLAFPLIIKPLTRLEPWNNTFGLRKAIYVENAEALQSLWPQLREVGLDLLAQEFIPGAEGRIESYHCYVDQRGDIAAEFTGRKIRTYPFCYGHTTALEITETDDVRQQGRAIVERLALTGVAKLDFKRDPQGNLRLLEINPRFNLWHHAGAIAGVNIPALVYADLVGIAASAGHAGRRPASAGAGCGRICRLRAPAACRSPRGCHGRLAAKPSRPCHGMTRCRSCALRSIVSRAAGSNPSKSGAGGGEIAADRPARGAIEVTLLPTTLHGTVNSRRRAVRVGYPAR